MTKPKRKTFEELEAEIDGTTLEQRRDQRAAQLETFLGSLTEEDRAGVLGQVNQYTKATGVRMVPASESVFDLNSKQKQLRQFEASQVFKEEDLPPIIKRTPGQRMDSMVARLKTASPEAIEAILIQIAGEYWKAGMPVNVDDLRRVAAHFLNQSERRKG